MKIGKINFGIWKAHIEGKGYTRPYIQILCMLFAYPFYMAGKVISFLAVLIGEWSIDDAIYWWKGAS